MDAGLRTGLHRLLNGLRWLLYPRKPRQQHCCWQLLQDLAAQVLFAQQLAVPPMPIDPELDGLLPF